MYKAGLVNNKENVVLSCGLTSGEFLRVVCVHYETLVDALFEGTGVHPAIQKHLKSVLSDFSVTSAFCLQGQWNEPTLYMDHMQTFVARRYRINAKIAILFSIVYNTPSLNSVLYNLPRVMHEFWSKWRVVMGELLESGMENKHMDLHKADKQTASRGIHGKVDELKDVQARMEVNKEMSFTRQGGRKKYQDGTAENFSRNEAIQLRTALGLNGEIWCEKETDYTRWYETRRDERHRAESGVESEPVPVPAPTTTSTSTSTSSSSSSSSTTSTTSTTATTATTATISISDEYKNKIYSHIPNGQNNAIVSEGVSEGKEEDEGDGNEIDDGNDDFVNEIDIEDATNLLLSEILNANGSANPNKDMVKKIEFTCKVTVSTGTGSNNSSVQSYCKPRFLPPSEMIRFEIDGNMRMEYDFNKIKEMYVQIKGKTTTNKNNDGASSSSSSSSSLVSSGSSSSSSSSSSSTITNTNANSSTQHEPASVASPTPAPIPAPLLAPPSKRQRTKSKKQLASEEQANEQVVEKNQRKKNKVNNKKRKATEAAAAPVKKKQKLPSAAALRRAHQKAKQNHTCKVTMLLHVGVTKEEASTIEYTNSKGERKTRKIYTQSSDNTQRMQRVTMEVNNVYGGADKLEKAATLIHSRIHRGKMTIPLIKGKPPGGAVLLNVEEVKKREKLAVREFRGVGLLNARKKDKVNGNSEATTELLRQLDQVDDYFYDCVMNGTNLYSNTDPKCRCPFCSCQIELIATDPNRQYPDGLFWPMFCKIEEDEEPKLHVSCDTPTLSRGIKDLESKLPPALKKLVDDGIGVDAEEGGV